jgi:serine/threonine protein kinase
VVDDSGYETFRASNCTSTIYEVKEAQENRNQATENLKQKEDSGMENPNGPAGVESKDVVQTPETPSTSIQPDAGIAEPNDIPPLGLYNVSPRRAKPSAIGRGVPLGEADPARTPTLEAHSYRHMGGSDVGGLINGQSVVSHGGECGYFIPNPTVRDSSSSQIASCASTSITSSPLHSGHASSMSFQSSHPDSHSIGDVEEISSRVLEDRSVAASPTSHSAAEESSSDTTSKPQVTRREGPYYPNQSFAALQQQCHPPPYEPHPLRARNSHPSQNSFFSSTASTYSRSRPSMSSGARTAGNTPAQSPGLFTTTSGSKYPNSGDDVEYVAPMLHPTHLQAPKETHKLLKDIDPISGRKIVNNYEFLSKLGSGTHGTVKLGRNLETSERVAIKIVRRFSKKVRLGKQESPEDKVKKEVAILKKARHPHVVSLLEVIDDQEFGKVYLILEYVELGEINWRTPAESHVGMFEMDRVKREMLDDVDETSEAEDIARFNQGVHARREEKHRIATELQYKTRSPEDTPYWSLEHGGDSEDDFRHLGLASDPATSKDASGYSLHDDHFQGPSRHGSLSRISTPTIPEEAEDVPSYLDHLSYQESIEDDDHNLGEEYKYVPCLTMAQALEAFRDTVLGLEYLHFQGIIHRDIKPANLLWNADHRVKISDFGVSYLGKPIREDDNNEEIEEADAANLDEAIELAKTVGTPAFYAPELCDPDLFDSDKTPERPLITGQIDVWALGVTLYGMIYGRLPFFDDNEFKMYEKIARQEVFIPRRRLMGVETNTIGPLTGYKRRDDELIYEDVDDELQDLLRRLLQKKPSKRITLKEVKHHPWVLRGIRDQSRWIDDTDPSIQSQGKRIEVSTQEVNEAVAPLTIVDRIKSGIRRLGSVVRGRDTNRKRAESNAKTSDTSIGDRQGRRTSLRGDEQIFSALRASRENTEHHPLAQSLAASPEMREDQSYFEGATIETRRALSRSNTKAQRPKPAERAISTAESIKTIKASGPQTLVREGTPPPIPETLPTLPALDSAQSSSSSLTGIFGGAGRLLVRGMRSRERGTKETDLERASQSSRASSMDNMASNFEDPHASPSLAFSPAVAAGHVDQPPIPPESPAVEHHPRPTSSQTSTILLQETTAKDAFEKAQEQNLRRSMQEYRQEQEQEQRIAQIQQRSRANTAVQCPPSPDDELFERQQRRQSQTSQGADMAVSSSDDHMTSGISESFSHPSIPSVVSGASSLATTGEELHSLASEQGGYKSNETSYLMSTSATITASGWRNSTSAGSVSGSVGQDDDEAGYNGDGDEEEGESGDEGIVFGKKGK